MLVRTELMMRRFLVPSIACSQVKDRQIVPLLLTLP